MPGASASASVRGRLPACPGTRRPSRSPGSNHRRAAVRRWDCACPALPCPASPRPRPVLLLPFPTLLLLLAGASHWGSHARRRRAFCPDKGDCNACRGNGIEAGEASDEAWVSSSHASGTPPGSPTSSALVAAMQAPQNLLCAFSPSPTDVHGLFTV